jgi:predicted transglutaminase-like cysteine proteinase
VQPGASWSSTILQRLGVSQATVIDVGQTFRAIGVACFLTASLAMSGIPSTAHAGTVDKAWTDSELDYIGSQAEPASIGRQGFHTYGRYPTAETARKGAFDAMIAGAGRLSTSQKLETVNNFFNERVLYQRDAEAWGKNDYWATLGETLTKGAGDCEDFAIAKYYTLQKLGIEQSHLRMVYVKSSQFPEPHMVLSYADKRGSDPLILDNIEKSISRLSSRTDLFQVYSFNDAGVYLPGKETSLAGPERLSKWVAVMNRAASEVPQKIQVAAEQSKPMDLTMLTTDDIKQSATIGSHLKSTNKRSLETDEPDLK